MRHCEQNELTEIQCKVSAHFILPAGGVGARMGQQIPKQYIEIKGKPILAYTLQAVEPYAESVVIAAANEYIPLCEEIARIFVPNLSVSVVEGGETRFHSIRNALKKLPQKGALIAIHDSVRPLVSRTVIERCLISLIQSNDTKAIAPYKEETDSLRLCQGDSFSFLDRSRVVRISTPQCFRSDFVQKAYSQPYKTSFTDDLSVYEALFGEQFILIRDNDENIKITTPIDLKILEFYLSYNK